MSLNTKAFIAYLIQPMHISFTCHVLQVDERVINGHNLHLLGGETSAGHQATDAAESESEQCSF